MRDERYKVCYFNTMNKKEPMYESPPLELDSAICRMFYELERLNCKGLVNQGYFEQTHNHEKRFIKRYIIKTNVPPLMIHIKKINGEIDVNEFNQRLEFFKKRYGDG